VPNCTAFNPANETCILANIAYTQPSNETLVIEYAGMIEFQNVTLGCTDECNDIFRWQRPDYCCHIIINATSDVTFALTAPSTLRFSDISIYSGGIISLGLNSILDATGMGYIQGPGYVDTTTGASFAAQSGFCD